MIRPVSLASASRPDPDDIARPVETLRLIGRSDVDIGSLVEAMADDILAMAPSAAGVAIRLSLAGEVRRVRRFLSSDAMTGAVMTAPIETYHGDAGELTLYMRPGTDIQPADHHAAWWIAALAASIADHRAMAGMDRARRVAEQRFDATFSHAPVGIAHVAPDGKFLLANDQFVAITGHSLDVLIEKGFQAITHPDDIDADMMHVNRLLSGQADRYMMEKRYIRPDKKVVWVNLTVSVVRDAQGKAEYFVSVIEDLSEVKRARAEATRDPLTGLLNRRGLTERLRREISRSAKSGRPLTIVYLDLDDFKRINDELGHAGGDTCLIGASEALVSATRPGDTIARIGGDEFVMVLPDLDHDTEALIDRLSAALVAAGSSLPWPIRGSFGAVQAGVCDDNSAEALIAAADAAMFQAKRRREKRLNG
jgi:diguanylate cyclase (GGDEF)-like protein/PAS domain S-box-containing protein